MQSDAYVKRSYTSYTYKLNCQIKIPNICEIALCRELKWKLQYHPIV